MGEWLVNWDSVEAQGQVLTFDDISEAPKKPGLYAWYGILGLGAADLADENQTRRALKRQTNNYKPTPLRGEVIGNLGMRWAGQLFDTSMDDLADILSKSEPDDVDNSSSQSRSKQRGQRLNRALVDPLTRHSLISVLEECVPVFLPPLYVGVTDNLCTRLRSHVNLFRSVTRSFKSGLEYLSPDLDVENTDETSGANFSIRAVKAGFKEDNLRAFVFPVQNIEKLNSTQIRNVIEGAEFLLNHWVRPSLGVR
jgi:hypothetical protein